MSKMLNDNTVFAIMAVIIVGLFVYIYEIKQDYKNYQKASQEFITEADSTVDFLIKCSENPLASGCDYNTGSDIGTRYKESREAIKK
jgi:hypothetical protein